MWEIYTQRITGITIWQKQDSEGRASYAATNNRSGICREPLGCNVYRTAAAAEAAYKADAALIVSLREELAADEE